MARRLVDDVVEQLMERVTAGEFAATPLPREQDLAEQCEVSRLTLREAVRALTTAGVLRVERGRGTYVNPVERWHDVAHVARVTGANGNAERTSLQLIEVRRLIEVGAVQLAAQRLSDEQIDALDECIAVMQDAHEDGDVARFAQADLDFHTGILTGTGNPFLPVLYSPIETTLRAAREETSSHEAVREHAIGYHHDIVAALRERDATAAVDAMTAHIHQTRTDIQIHVIGGE